MENTTFTSKNFPTISHAPFLIGDFHVTSGKPFVKGAQDCERSQAKAVGLWQKRWPTRRWQRGLPLKVMGSKCGINHEGFMKMCDKLWRVCSYCDILKIGSLKKKFHRFHSEKPYLRTTFYSRRVILKDDLQYANWFIKLWNDQRLHGYNSWRCKLILNSVQSHGINAAFVAVTSCRR